MNQTPPNSTHLMVQWGRVAGPEPQGSRRWQGHSGQGPTVPCSPGISGYSKRPSVGQPRWLGSCDW